MELDLPHNVKDTDALARWLNKLRNWVKRNQLYSSSDILVSQTTTGTTLTLATRIKPLAAPVVSTPSSASQMMTILTMPPGDWFTAVPIIGRTFTGGGFANVTGSTVVVAKSPRLRNSVVSEVIDGVTITYSSQSNANFRTANDGVNSEFQCVVPRYVTSSVNPLSCSYNDTGIIFAQWAVNAGLTGSLPGFGVISGSGWVEALPHREWANRYIV